MSKVYEAAHLHMTCCMPVVFLSGTSGIREDEKQRGGGGRSSHLAISKSISSASPS